MKKSLLLLLCLPVAALALTWEYCENQARPISRAPINSGWLVAIDVNPPQYIYIPDKKHEWECNE